MSGIMNKLGLGHTNHADDRTTATSTVNTAADLNRGVMNNNTSSLKPTVYQSGTAANTSYPTNSSLANQALNQSGLVNNQSDLVNNTSTNQALNQSGLNNSSLTGQALNRSGVNNTTAAGQALNQSGMINNATNQALNQSDLNNTTTTNQALNRSGVINNTTTNHALNQGLNKSTINQPMNSSINQPMNSSINTAAPYGASNSDMTSRTGAAYTGQAATATSGIAGNTGIANQEYGQSTRLSGPDAMTRSEEQLRVAKMQVETGVAALDKSVSVEHVEKVIPVQRERVVIEREPITCTNLPQAMTGPAISEGHYETVLHEDRIAAQKETVPVERIRLAKQVETSVQNVGADLAKEHIDLTVNEIENSKIDPTLSKNRATGVSSTSGYANDKLDARSSTTGLVNDKLDTRSRSGLTNESAQMRNSTVNSNINSRNV